MKSFCKNTPQLVAKQFNSKKSMNKPLENINFHRYLLYSSTVMINPFIENYRQRWDFVWKRIVTFLVMDSLSGDQHQRQPTSSPHSLTQEEALAAVNKCITELEQLLAIQTLYTAPVHSRRMWLSEICRVLPYHRYFSSQIASRCLAFIKNVQWTS